MSKLMRKAKEFLTSDHRDSIRSSNDEPHHSNLANTLDPRADSENAWKDNRARYEAIGGACGPRDTNVSHKHGAQVERGTDAQDSPDYYHLGSAKYYGHGGTAGLHDSHIGSKLEPWADKDRDNRTRHN